MSEIKHYVETLDNYDEKNPIISEFVRKMEEPFEYKFLLAQFEWKRRYFKRLDNLLIAAGYRARDDIIAEVKDFLRTKLKYIGIMKYNKLFGANIWNHIEIVDKFTNRKKQGWFYQDGINEYDSDYSNWIDYWFYDNSASIDIIEKQIGKSDFSYRLLSPNSGAFELLCTKPDMIDISELSSNRHPEAIELIRQHIANCDMYKTSNYLCWYSLSENPAAIDLLRENPGRIRWPYCFKNSAAIDLIKERIADCEKLGISNTIDWQYLCQNSSAIELLKQNPEKINWRLLSLNSGAIELLEANMDKIDWQYLSRNTGAIRLLRENPDKIDYNRVSRNPAAIDIIKKYLADEPWRVNDNYYMQGLSFNNYDYTAEKIEHFNSLDLFPRSQLEI